MDNTKWLDLSKQAREAMEQALQKDLAAKFNKPKIALFASPEAELAKNLTESVEEEVLCDERAKNSKQGCIGLDIELKESVRFERKKKTAWEHGSERISVAKRRWQKATTAIGTKMSAGISKTKTVDGKSDIESDDAKESASKVLNRCRWYRARGLCSTMKKSPLKLSLNEADRKKELKCKNDIDIDKTNSCEALKIPNVTVEDRGLSGIVSLSPRNIRFGRRVSISNSLSKSLPDQFKPSPPPTRNTLFKSLSDTDTLSRSQQTLSVCNSPRSSSPASSGCSSPCASRRRFSLTIDNHSWNKPSVNGLIPKCSENRTNKRKSSVTSDLETNRNIVSDLVHQRSEAISHLSSDESSSVSAEKTQSSTNGKKVLLPRRCRNTQPRQAWETTEGQTRSSTESIDGNDSFKDDEILKSARRRRSDYEQVTLTDYIDLKDNSSLTLKENTFSELSQANVDRSSERRKSWKSLSTDECTSDSLVKCKPLRNNTLCKNATSDYRSRVAPCQRTDADIVKDVEAEIQQRISRRKQQLLNKTGSTECQMLQQRFEAHSVTGQLKKVIADLNEKRTTSELWQIAAQKSRLQYNQDTRVISLN